MLLFRQNFDDIDVFLKYLLSNVIDRLLVVEILQEDIIISVDGFSFGVICFMSKFATAPEVTLHLTSNTTAHFTSLRV